MKAKPPSSDLLQRVTVVIRSVGERTEDACRALVLEQGVSPEAVFVVRERPFSKTLRVSSEIGIEQGRKWTLFVDADLLLRPSSIERMLARAENQPAGVCQIQGYCLDKFFGGTRIGGIHLYRTSLLGDFITSIPEEGVDIRPETRALKKMASKGFHWVIVPELIGLHGFDQSYEDIFRISFVHAHKHAHLADLFLTFWRSREDSDEDYQVALAGFAAGRDHPGDVRIDKGAPYFLDARFASPRFEKPVLPSSAWSLGRVQEIINGWEEPTLYRFYLSRQMVGSSSRLFSRAVSSLRSNLTLKGPVKATLAWLRRTCIALSKNRV